MEKIKTTVSLIELCHTCINECDSCADEMKEIPGMENCIRYLTECADACEQVIASQAEDVSLLYGCISACKTCADECESHDYDACKTCAEICRECSAECAKVA